MPQLRSKQGRHQLPVIFQFPGGVVWVLEKWVASAIVGALSGEAGEVYDALRVVA